MFEAQPVYDLMENRSTYGIVLPTGKEQVVFLRGTNLPEQFKDEKGRGRVSGLDWRQTVFLGQLLSKESGAAYALPSPEQIVKLTREIKRNKDGMKDVFDDLYSCCIYNRPLIKRVGSKRVVIENPTVRDIDGTLYVFGEPARVVGDSANVSFLKTLSMARSDDFDYGSVGIDFRDGDEVAVLSCYRDNFRTSFMTVQPSGRISNRTAAFAKVDARAVAEKEYEELLRDAGRFRRLKPRLEEIALEMGRRED